MKGTVSTALDGDQQVHDITKDDDTSIHIALYLSTTVQFENMPERILTIRTRKDEYDIDFNDPRLFAVRRYNDIVDAIKEATYLPEDFTALQEWERQSVQQVYTRMLNNPSSTIRRYLNQWEPLPRTLGDLARHFENSVKPEEVDMAPLWGLLYQNLKLSVQSVEKLKRTTDWVLRLRRNVEVFNSSLLNTPDVHKNNEVRIAIVDIFDPLLSAFTESINFLRRAKADAEISRDWPEFSTKVSQYTKKIKEVVSHLEEMSNTTAANRQREQHTLISRQGLVPEPKDPATFPIKSLPYRRNPKFYSRKADLDKINQAVDFRQPGAPLLRSYTIYGRRGVGKTELAMEYAHTNPAGFDAIFWIGCETVLSLRQSFTNMAVQLNLPGAIQHGHDEENQLAVLRWLKVTQGRWLLIFDNAEKKDLLKSYWPRGANGAILITSRNYYNFMKDEDRQGHTVMPFSPPLDFELLFQFLGESWYDLFQQQRLEPSEATAAREFLKYLLGLPLAITQASNLITNHKVGGDKITKTFEMFKERLKTLPPRLAAKRTDTYQALDTLWDMNFRLLSKNGFELLKVLSLLSPDTTYLELFLPAHQTVLDGKLSFCKQPGIFLDEKQNALTKVLSPSEDLEKAVQELLAARLIRREGRVLSVHREVQEATNYHNQADFQEAFDAAVRVVAEAFPKRRGGVSLFSQWAICGQYIHDAVHLIKKYAQYARRPLDEKRVTSTITFIEMIGNCAWYLYEVGDYDQALEIIQIGWEAHGNADSLYHADLCNTAGTCYLEKNFLVKCREVLETSMRIRERDLNPDHIDIAATSHNLGNLMTAIGDYDDAMQFFQKAIEIRNKQGEEAANQLGLLYLCIARVYSLQQKWDETERNLNKSENLFVRTIGAEKHYMAHVHYAYGHLDYRRSNYLAARRSYYLALNIARAETPVHPITCAAHYSLGRAEYRLEHRENARHQFEKALAIAQLRSPAIDDGTITRILWAQSRVLEWDPLRAHEASQLRERAKRARTELILREETATDKPEHDDEGLDFDEAADRWNVLVPIFFR